MTKQAYGSITCTKENPVTDEELQKFALHPDADEVYSDWEYECYLCPNCGYSYKLWYDEMK